MIEWSSMGAWFRELAARQRRSPEYQLWRPRLEALEPRYAPSCTGGSDEPWCLDDPFGGNNNGHAQVQILNRAEGHAVAVQSVAIGGGQFERRILVAGWADGNANLDEYKFTLARLCPNGKLDDGTGNCSGAGFGADHSGVAIKDFYGNFYIEQIEAITIQPNQHSDTCDGTGLGTSDKIVVAGRIPPH